MVSSRFQIEDIVSQDSAGAVFLAIDTQTEREVLLQRFFPFGPEEDGLKGEELSSYDLGIQQIKQLEDARLRRVIDGGCDPVDGIPYLVSEALTGISLREFCANTTMTTAQAHQLVESALALMLVLEKTFGQTADWLSIQIDHIEVIGDAEHFRFGVDPMKWLGLRPGIGSVKELVALVETVMGWKGRVLVGSAVGHVGAWMAAAKNRNLNPSQAWEFLQSGVVTQQKAPAAAASAPLTASATSYATAAPASKKVPLASAKSGGNTGWIIIGVLCVVGGIAVAIVKLLNSGENPPANVTLHVPVEKAPDHSRPIVLPSADPVAPIPPTTTTAVQEKPTTQSQEDKMRADIERRALELQAQAGPVVTAKPNTPTGPKQPKKAQYQPGEIALIREQTGEAITVVAKVSKVKLSSTGKSLYVEFDGGAPERVLGRYLTSLGAEGMSVSELGSLEGKWVQATGIVRVEIGTDRVVIDLKTPTQLVEIPAPQK